MSDSSTARRDDSPAVALGPTALVLGALSAVGAWVPALALITLPWSLLAGALAVTFGALGIHHARRGACRLGTAVAGAVLGAAGIAGTVALVWALGA